MAEDEVVNAHIADLSEDIKELEAERDRLRAALEALWSIMLNGEPCDPMMGAVRPACAAAFAQVREALDD